MNYDLSNNKNNLDFYFDVNQLDNKIVKLIMTNIATRTYKEDVKINNINKDLISFERFNTNS